MISIRHNDKVATVCVTAFQQLLHTQTPWGEWGKGYTVRADRGRAIDREGMEESEKWVPKPNMYRTLAAAQILRELHGDRYDHRIGRAWNWITKCHLDKGCFYTWYPGQNFELEVEGMSLKTLNYEVDLRHTAEALVFALQFRNLDDTAEHLLPGLHLLLDNQQNGAWGEKVGLRKVQPIATTYAVEFLLRLPLNKLLDLSELSAKDANTLKQRVDASTSAGVAWLIRQAQDKTRDLKDRIQKMAHTLYRLGPVMGGAGQPLGQAVVDTTLLPGNADHLSYQDLVRFAVGVVVAQRMGIAYPKVYFKHVCARLVDEFNYRALDAPDYIWLLETFKDEPGVAEAVRGASYFDYLDPNQENRPKAPADKADNFSLLSHWLAESLLRIDNLRRGVELNVEDYDVVSGQERARVEEILDTLEDLGVGKVSRQVLEHTRTILLAPASAKSEKAWEGIESLYRRSGPAELLAKLRLLKEQQSSNTRSALSLLADILQVVSFIL